MEGMALHAFHEALGARFGAVGGGEGVLSYGDWRREHRALRSAAAAIDLSARGRLVLLGADRQKFLNGQVTNNVKELATWSGCHALLVNPKARVLADMQVYALPNELLLDVEPGLGPVVAARLEQFVVGEDVQVVDAAPHYGLLGVQGLRADRVVEALGLVSALPSGALEVRTQEVAGVGEVYVARHERVGLRGYDLYVPTGSMVEVAERLSGALAEIGGGWCGWEAFEVARVEAGIPRYGADIDETNLAPEAGVTERAISYTKGCYIGQEVIARIRTYGQVTKALRGLRLTGAGEERPGRGTRLFHGGKDVGYLTSVVESPERGEVVGLGYVRKECNGPGTRLRVGVPDGAVEAEIVPLPLVGVQWA
ncbi:MAG: aminomethyltransferase family protein [Verrucomicrobiae bacterium]|nr:aminomethyltransferase family protein [Verrucomicrobiae bacterium]